MTFPLGSSPGEMQSRACQAPTSPRDSQRTIIVFYAWVEALASPGQCARGTSRGTDGVCVCGRICLDRAR